MVTQKNNLFSVKDEHVGSMKKKGTHYSKQESDIILRMLHNYLNANGLMIKDICPELRGVKSRAKKVFSGIWNEIACILPQREMRSIYNHAIRKLMAHTRHGKWTEDEKETLHTLYDTYGPNWAVIGREMGKYRGDCKDTFRRLQPSVKIGRWTIDEDSQLLAILKKLYNVKSVLEIPTTGIPWKRVASKLGNTRHPLALSLRWTSVRKKKIHGNVRAMPSALDDDKIRLDLDMLELIEDSGAEVDDEVPWRELDRKLVQIAGYSKRRWLLLCKTCDGFSPSFSACLRQLMERRQREATALEDLDN